MPEISFIQPSVQLQHAPSDVEELALVLEATGLPYILKDGGLWVAEKDAEAACYQLQLYELENHDWPPVVPRQQEHPQAPPTVLILGVLVVFYGVTGPWTADNPWFQGGCVDKTAIFQHGEWWRLVTGLTLHADLVHLLGNCAIGGVLIHLLSKILGYGLAWLLLILAGAAGNWLNVVVREGPHLSVGLSTAVFAAVGMLTALQMLHKNAPRWKTVLAPLGAGLALLALLGTTGEHTDLGAHFFGFLTGLGTGSLLRATPVISWCRPALVQAGLLAAALALVTFSWWCTPHPW